MCADDFRVTIEVSKTYTLVRIAGISLTDDGEFDSVYKKARLLLSRIPQLDKEIEFQIQVQQANSKTAHLWTQEDEVWKLSDTVSDSSHRIALSLLRSYPLPKTQASVVLETGVAQKTVSNHLGGRKKSVRSYFKDSGGGHQLSEEGLRWTIEKIIPEIVNPRREDEDVS